MLEIQTTRAFKLNDDTEQQEDENLFLGNVKRNIYKKR